MTRMTQYKIMRYSRIIILTAAFLLVTAANLQAQAPDPANSQPVVIRNEAGAVERSVHPVYDNHDRIAVQIEYTYSDSGIVETRTLRSFDKQGRERKTETYSADEYPIFTQTIRYDNKGRRTRIVQTSYNDDGSTITDTFKYKYKPDGCHTFLNGKEMTP